MLLYHQVLFSIHGFPYSNIEPDQQVVEKNDLQQFR